MKYGLSYTRITGVTGLISRTALHFRRTELKYIANFVKNVKNKKILDYGCNTGYFLDILDKSSPSNQYFGADINPHALKFARNKYKKYKFYNIDKRFLNKKFDIVILSHVLEHVEDRDALLKNISAVLKKNGHLIISVPQERVRGDATIFQFLYNIVRLRFENPHVVKLDHNKLNSLLKGYKNIDKIYTHYLYPFKSNNRRFDTWSFVGIYKKLA